MDFHTKSLFSKSFYISSVKIVDPNAGKNNNNNTIEMAH